MENFIKLLTATFDDKKKIDYLRKRLKIWYIIRKKSSYKDDYNE